MASEMVTREVAFGVRHVPKKELFTVTAGIPTDQVEQFASYLLRFIEARMWELGVSLRAPCRSFACSRS